MIKSVSIFLCMIAAAAVILTSCESGNAFRTSRGMRKQIQGRWVMSQLAETDPYEEWVFDNGDVYRDQKDTIGRLVHIDTAKYSINATLTSPYLTISEMMPLSALNAKWEIITLDDKVLRIVHGEDDNFSGGLLLREFYKK